MENKKNDDLPFLFYLSLIIIKMALDAFLPTDIHQIVYTYMGLKWDDHYKMLEFFKVPFTIDQLFKLYTIPTLIDVCKKEREYVDVVSYIIDIQHIDDCGECIEGKCNNMDPYIHAMANKYYGIIDAFDKKLYTKFCYQIECVRYQHSSFYGRQENQLRNMQ